MQGKDSRRSQQYQEVGDRKNFRTRVVRTANTANLKYEDAKNFLTGGLTHSLANLFELCCSPHGSVAPVGAIRVC